MSHLIASFAVDHTNLQPGIYLSRTDKCNDQIISTFDIRMTAPNREPAVAPAPMHTIEHLVATFLRNDPEWKDRIVYWGPMGCLTGSYLIVKGEFSPLQIRPLMIRAFQYILDANEVPGQSPECCGNYLLHDLPMAKWAAKRYIQRLNDSFFCEYTPLVRRETEDGSIFHDA